MNEAVDFKMAENQLVREGVVVMCDSLMEECQQILEKKEEIRLKIRRLCVKPWTQTVS